MTHEGSLIEEYDFNKAVFCFFKIGIEKERIILYNDISIKSGKASLPPESIWLSAGCLLLAEEMIIKGRDKTMAYRQKNKAVSEKTKQTKRAGGRQAAEMPVVAGFTGNLSDGSDSAFD